jgi:alpha-tubulin suppressor-like RCC1 family protein
MVIYNKRKIKVVGLLLSFLVFATVFSGIEAKAAESSNADLISITINGQRLSIVYPWMTNYDLELPANTPEQLLNVIGEPDDLKSIVSIEGNKLINKSALVKVIVTAENKTTKKTYYVNVTLKEPSITGSFIDIKTADFHSLALKSDGTLYGFGENESGQLGDGSRETRNKPVQVKSITNVIDFDTSNSHSAAVTSDGSVWVWGLNDYGQLNPDNKIDVLSPIKVDGLQNIIKVRTGNRFNIALDKSGLVWFWGYNSKGQLEDEEDTGVLKPQLVRKLSSFPIKDIEAGDFHSLALSEEGKVYAWGSNEYGQLGNGTTSNKYYPTEINNIGRIKFINAKGNTSSCVSEDGSVYIFGETNYLYGEFILTPEEVQNVYSTYIIEANSNNIVQLDLDGQVNAYGNNDYGQLGNGSYSSRAYFSSVNGAGRARKISTSPHNIFIIGEDGCIYGAGRNNEGQLGTSTSGQSASTLQKITELGDSQVDRVYADKSSGEVPLNTTIKLATSALSSKIYYTLDGSDPTEKSTLYVSPIPVTKYTIIKAVAVKNGKYSAVSTFQYMASNSTEDMTVSIGTKTAVSGTVIEVPITFLNVPQAGIANLKFAVQFNPEVLSLSDVVSGDIVKDSKDFSYSNTWDGKIILSFSDSTKTSNNITKSGTFAVLKLYLRNSNSSGKFTITQTFTTGEGFYSRNYKKYEVKYNQGHIATGLLYGDVDGDQKVTALDMQYIQRYVLNKLYYFPGNRGREAADMDKNGTIDAKDIELINNLILKGE